MKKILLILSTLLFINLLVMSLSKAFAYAYHDDINANSVINISKV